MATNHPIKITIQNGYYVMKSPRDQRLIDALKAAINYTQRQWDGQQFAWIIHPKAINALIAAIERAGYERPDVPEMSATAVQTVITKTFTVEYIGQCKPRNDSEIISALGTTNAQNPWTGNDGRPRYQWQITFPEAVLKAWFERKPVGDNVQTFYQVLCVFESATDQEIKSAHRRLARQWHPDVCSEPEAAEKFRELTDAFEILREPGKRRRYDAGLFFEREAKKNQSAVESPYTRGRRKFIDQHFRSPLRCGLITAEGVQSLNRFTVSKILSWDDITDASGRVMTASWNKHTESIEIKWI